MTQPSVNNYLEARFPFLYPIDFTKEEAKAIEEQFSDLSYKQNLVLSYDKGTYKRFLLPLVLKMLKENPNEFNTEMVTELDLTDINSGKHEVYKSLNELREIKYLLINLGLAYVGDENIVNLVISLMGIRYLSGKVTWIMIKQPIDYYEEIKEKANDYNFKEILFAMPIIQGFAHSSDYCSVKLNGEKFVLTPSQSVIVKILHENYQNGTPEVSERYLCGQLEGEDCTNIKGSRIHDIFRNSNALGRLIVGGERRATYRLNLEI